MSRVPHNGFLLQFIRLIQFLPKFSSFLLSRLFVLVNDLFNDFLALSFADRGETILFPLLLILALFVTEVRPVLLLEDLFRGRLLFKKVVEAVFVCALN